MFTFTKRQRALSEMDRRRSAEETYTTPLKGNDSTGITIDPQEIKVFLQDFYKQIIFQPAVLQTELTDHADTVGVFYQRLVVESKTLSKEDFWQRYFYRTSNVDRVMAELEAMDAHKRKERTAAWQSALSAKLEGVQQTAQAVAAKVEEAKQTVIGSATKRPAEEEEEVPLEGREEENDDSSSAHLEFMNAVDPVLSIHTTMVETYFKDAREEISANSSGETMESTEPSDDSHQDQKDSTVEQEETTKSSSKDGSSKQGFQPEPSISLADDITVISEVKQGFQPEPSISLADDITVISEVKTIDSAANDDDDDDDDAVDNPNDNTNDQDEEDMESDLAPKSLFGNTTRAGKDSKSRTENKGKQPDEISFSATMLEDIYTTNDDKKTTPAAANSEGVAAALLALDFALSEKVCTPKTASSSNSNVKTLKVDTASSSTTPTKSPGGFGSLFSNLVSTKASVASPPKKAFPPVLEEVKEEEPLLGGEEEKENLQQTTPSVDTAAAQDSSSGNMLWNPFSKWESKDSSKKDERPGSGDDDKEEQNIQPSPAPCSKPVLVVDTAAPQDCTSTTSRWNPFSKWDAKNKGEEATTSTDDNDKEEQEHIHPSPATANAAAVVVETVISQDTKASTNSTSLWNPFPQWAAKSKEDEPTTTPAMKDDKKVNDVDTAKSTPPQDKVVPSTPNRWNPIPWATWNEEDKTKDTDKKEDEKTFKDDAETDKLNPNVDQQTSELKTASSILSSRTMEWWNSLSNKGMSSSKEDVEVSVTPGSFKTLEGREQEQAVTKSIKAGDKDAKSTEHQRDRKNSLLMAHSVLMGILVALLIIVVPPTTTPSTSMISTFMDGLCAPVAPFQVLTASRDHEVIHAVAPWWWPEQPMSLSSRSMMGEAAITMPTKQQVFDVVCGTERSQTILHWTWQGNKEGTSQLVLKHANGTGGQVVVFSKKYLGRARILSNRIEVDSLQSISQKKAKYAKNDKSEVFSAPWSRASKQVVLGPKAWKKNSE